MKGFNKKRINKKEFENLFKENYNSLYYYALSYTNDPEVSKDIISDIFEHLWAKLDDIDSSYSLKPYLCRLVKTRSIDYIRHRRVKQKYCDLNIDLDLLAQLDFENDDKRYESLIPQVIKEIGNLPPQNYNVFKLCFLENKKYKEIAEEMHISVNTVKTHIKKSLMVIRKNIKD